MSDNKILLWVDFNQKCRFLYINTPDERKYVLNFNDKLMSDKLNKIKLI